MSRLKRTHGSLMAWGICLLGALFYCYEYLLRVSPSVMSSRLMGYYHLSAASFGNLSSYYYYVYVPMQLFVGLLFDRYGPRKLLTLALVSCTIGIFIFASTHILGVAELGRFLMGFGSAFAFVGVLKLATIWLPPNRFGLVSGLALALGMLGGLLGDLVLTHLVNFQGWRATCFWASGVGVLLTLLIGLVVHDNNPDIPEEQQQTKIHSVVMAWPQLIRILTNPQIWLNGAIGCLMYLPLSSFAELWAIPFFKQGYHLSSSQAAFASSIIFLGWLIGGPVMGSFSDYIRRRRILMTIGGLLAAGFISLIIYGPHFSASTVYCLLFFFGIFSSPQVLVFPVGREISPSLLTGTALALTNMMVMVGGFFVPLIGFFLDISGGRLAENMHVFSMTDYRYGLMLIPVALIVASVLSFFLKETYCKPIIK